MTGGECAVHDRAAAAHDDARIRKSPRLVPVMPFALGERSK